MENADVIVAEVTQPSLGVGYELGIAQKLGKKVLCLYHPQEGKRLSAMVKGNKKYEIKEYQNTSEIPHILNEFFSR